MSRDKTKKDDCELSFSVTISELYNDSATADHVLIINSNQYPVHKCILAARFSYFRKVWFTTPENAKLYDEFSTNPLALVLPLIIEGVYTSKTRITAETLPHCIAACDDFGADDAIKAAILDHGRSLLGPRSCLAYLKAFRLLQSTSPLVDETKVVAAQHLEEFLHKHDLWALGVPAVLDLLGLMKSPPPAFASRLWAHALSISGPDVGYMDKDTLERWASHVIEVDPRVALAILNCINGITTPGPAIADVSTKCIDIIIPALQQLIDAGVRPGKPPLPALLQATAGAAFTCIRFIAENAAAAAESAGKGRGGRAAYAQVPAFLLIHYLTALRGMATGATLPSSAALESYAPTITTVTPELAPEVLAFFDTIDVPRLHALCIDTIVSNFGFYNEPLLWASMLPLCPDRVISMILSENLAPESEDQVLLFITAYMKAHGELTTGQIDQLWSAVRLPYLSWETLENLHVVPRWPQQEVYFAIMAKRKIDADSTVEDARWPARSVQYYV